MEYLVYNRVRNIYFFFGSYMNDIISYVMNELCCLFY